MTLDNYNLAPPAAATASELAVAKYNGCHKMV